MTSKGNTPVVRRTKTVAKSRRAILPQFLLEMTSKGSTALVRRYKVVAKVDKPRRVSPSIYTREMKQTSEERLNNAVVHPPRILELFDDKSSVSCQKTTIVGLDQALFQPYPSELIFQNFSPELTYELPLVLLNNDKVPRCVKLEQVDSLYFQVKRHESPGKKVAPGMTATFSVLFTPQENMDYCHSLFFCTERERFEVPISAIGPRAILNFGDDINLPACLVKASTEKTCFVRNVGNCQAKFKLYTQSPFSVTPSSGTLDVHEGIQVTVDFQPITSGVYKDEMILHYHTGEDVHISLHGICEEANLQLRPNSVWFEKTFISLVSQQTVSLTNKNDVPLRYCWKAWPTQQEKDLRESSDLKQVKGDKERPHSPFDPTAIHHLPLLSTSLQNGSSQTRTNDPQDFSHDCISIQPAEGEIWPNMTANFNVTFKPKEAKLYQQTLYCDVTGCESMLPLNINGEGTGPSIVLDYYLKDMKNVFIGDKDYYMVKVSNKGLIDAYFRLSGPDTTFGRCFSFSPEEGVIPSGACQIVEVTFHSCDLGSFSEDLLLAVTGRPQPLTLTFRGCVIAPTFHFNVSTINFGDVAFGFPLITTCTLFNTSFVPMTFSLRVVGDGQGPSSVNGFQQVSDLSRKNWQGLTGANEFTVSPDTDTVGAMSDVIIKVTLCSNTVRVYSLALVVDVEGVGKDIMTLPISARCVVPDILVQTPVLDYQRCFINCIKQQHVRLTNPSKLPACYGVLDQEHDGTPLLLFHSSSPRGVILGGCSVEIPVNVSALAVGRLEHELKIALFGSLQTPLEVKLSIIGQGPVVHVQDTNLDFGRIPVLTDTVRTLQLTNQSPIPANFSTPKLKGSFWHVEPSDGVVPPESTLEINVVANLKDTLFFEGQLNVSIQDSHMHTVALTATGTGTTLVSDKPLGPNLDLGTYFSHEPCQYSFKLTNQGKRVHLIYWKIENSTFLPQNNDDLSSGLPPHSSTQKPLFSISPNRVELFPGDSVDMLLTGLSHSPKVVQECLICSGIIGQQGSKQNIMAVNMTCQFVAPKLSISPKELNFCIKKEMGKDLPLLYEKLVLKNVTSLLLTMELSTEEPFFFCDAPGDQSVTTAKSMVLGDESLAECWICFNPAYYQDEMSRRLDMALQIHYHEHPQTDLVELHAEVHYPNLHFSSTTVDFGCVINCTRKERAITITNCSHLPVSYHWTFVDGQKHRETDNREKTTAEEENTSLQIHPQESMGSSELVSPAISFPDSFSVDERDCTPYLQEIFDILPLYGHLEPEEQREVVFSFYGHEDISSAVVAQCHVEDGPTYEVQLTGEASEISYSLSSTHLDFGFQLFYQTGEVEVVLRNTGKVHFFFTTINPAEQASYTQLNEEDPEVRPSCPVVIPAQGHINAYSEQCLRVLYLPGIPGEFSKKIRLQVAFLPPQDIILSGVGVFPRISLSLPRNLYESHHDIMEQARATLEAEREKRESKKKEDATESTSIITNEELLHLEVDKLLVKESALKQCANLQELRDAQGLFKNGNKIRRLVLPEYVLDFGYVILGKVVSHSVKVINSGLIPVSFQLDCRQLAGTGFKAELERVKDLPCGETHTLTVMLDTRGADVQMGNVSATMAIQIMFGPTVQLRMSAVVTMPAASASVDVLHFETVQCGMCQMRTIQLFNHGLLPCQWNMAEEVKPFKEVDKFLPFYERKRLLAEQRPPPAVFEMFPSSGMLSVGEQVNIQINFSPIEECAYDRRLLVNVAESTQQVWITARGQGVEPQLEFCPEVLELRPCLPLSTDVMAEIKVRNPCTFPVEFYSLEFDNQYLEDEKILRLMPGYDENNTLLLPPRFPGEGLPKELHNYYKDISSQQKDDEDESEEKRDKQEENQPEQNDANLVTPTGLKATENFLKLTGQTNGERWGESELNPVWRATAIHMGLDLSPEGLAARNSKGIAIIVYGAPQTDKKSTVADLGLLYDVVGLSIDSVVSDALLNGLSPVGLAARQVFQQAAEENAKKITEESDKNKDVEDATNEAPVESSKPPDPNPAQASFDSEESPAKHNENNSREKDPEAHLDTITKNIASCLGGDLTSLQDLLSEQIMVDILAERFQSSDCYCGLVIDGLDSVYTQSPSATLQVVLKALKKRKHIYVVNISDSYAATKAREQARREAEEALRKASADGSDDELLNYFDEETFDGLPEEKKQRIIEVKKLEQRKLRELEKKKKEEAEKMEQAEMKRLSEEDLQRKSKKNGKRNSKDVSTKKKDSTETLNGRKNSVTNKTTESTKRKTPSEDTEMNQIKTGSENCSKEQMGQNGHLGGEEISENDVDDLQHEFTKYEKNLAQMNHILQYWDRSQGLLMSPISREAASPRTDIIPTKKKFLSGKESKKGNRKTMSRSSSQIVIPEEEVSPPDIVPFIVLNVEEKKSLSVQQLFKSGALPPKEEVLNDLGLGPRDLLALPPVTFSIVPFPKNREQAKIEQSCFTFIQPAQEKQAEVIVQASPEKDKQEGATSKSPIASSKRDKEKKNRKEGKKKSTSKTNLKALDESKVIDEDLQPLELAGKQRVTKFRWIVPAGGEVTLGIWFYSESPGTFEQTFNFELLGTQKHYHLPCRGISTYPSISQDYKTIFAHSKKVAETNGLEKAYAINSSVFEFGPLVCSKSRDRYKESQYPENSEKLVIHNNSVMEAEVEFCFQHDTKASTYLLDPPTMTLKPNEEKELTVMAYPTQVGQERDSIVCRVKDNSEVVIINVSCWGVWPELVLEKKKLHFDRILQHREDSRSLDLVNMTAVPVSWRLQGVEELGSEFKVPEDQGVIPPYSSLTLNVYFKSRKQLSIKKTLHLEVSDVGNILGVVQTESIQVTAEAYEIQLAIKPDGFHDFGTIKVFDEATQSLMIKNCGKYAIDFKMAFAGTELDSIFSVSPQSGTLLPKGKPTSVLIVCKPDREVNIYDQTILYCKVIDPKHGKGEVVATPAIKASLKSVFSRYDITPSRDMDFGPLAFGSKKSQSFIIKNTGDLENHFTILRMPSDQNLDEKSGGARDSLSGGSTCSTIKGKRESTQRDRGSIQNCLNTGVFSVAPCSGILQPGTQQHVQVDCVAEQLGSWNRGLLIDIIDRDPSDHPDGIPYRLLAEVCKPAIDLDMASILEEHYLCNNRSQLSSKQFCNAEGIYIQDENEFVFNVLVGHAAQARFKLTNISKVLCVLHMAIQAVGSKGSQNVEGFHLSTPTMTIPPQSHAFAVVTFTPQSMQLYSGVFKATIEGSSRSSTAGTRRTHIPKNKALNFTLTGNGILPSVCVVRPVLRTSEGCPMLQFGRILAGFSKTIALVLHNDGNVPAQVHIAMQDQHGVFNFLAAPNNSCSVKSTKVEDASTLGYEMMHEATLKLNVDETVEFKVSFCSGTPQSVEATISLQVEDNQYNNITIPVTGETYQEIVSLVNVNRSRQEVDELDEGDCFQVQHFGDCYVGCSYQEHFIMTNHSSSQAIKFEWPPVDPHLTFLPQVGHLHAGCSKEVKLTFTSNKPVTLTRQPVKCKISQVEFGQPIDQVHDWDDRPRAMQRLTSTDQVSKSSQHPEMKKTVPEPSCSVVKDSVWTMDLYISAVCDYAKFSCSTENSQFQDTMLYQTRIHELQIANKGSVDVEFSWQIVMDSSSKKAKCEQGGSSPQPSSSAAGSGSPPSSALEGVVSHFMGSPEQPPFHVEPSFGVIKPATEQNFRIRFSPLEVGQFQGMLVCSIPNLKDGDLSPSISVSGKSLLPHCHFDLEDSDYLSGNRRSSEFISSLDPETKVLEFTTFGISTSQRTFTVLNPTGKPYTFEWRCEDRGSSHFRCLTTSGIILSGQRVEVSFEYVAEQLDTVESVWSFMIETLSLSVPFLCVGTSKEPLVYFDRPHLDFGELLLGHKVEQQIMVVNEEEESFSFSVIQSSLLSEDQESLILQPMSGKIAPKERLPLSVSFRPSHEGYVGFRMLLKLNGKSEPLMLPVKAEGFTVRASVQVEKSKGVLQEIDHNQQETLDFGKVGITEQGVFRLFVTNLARFNQEVDIELSGPKELLQYLQAKPQNALVNVGEQLESSLFLCPGSVCILKDITMTVRVRLGPVFTFRIKGRAVEPILNFSFTKHDFGTCFLHGPSTVPPSHTLMINNNGTMDISIQSPFQDTTFLKMNFQADILSPGAVMEVPFTFYPHEARQYNAKIPFILNSCVTKEVDILGQGMEIKLEVAEARHRKVKLRTLMAGQKVKKQVVVVNRSSLDLQFSLVLNANTPVNPKDLSIFPAGKLKLKSNGSCEVDILFSPRQHILPFTAELLADLSGFLHPLLTIDGCCQDVKVLLDPVQLSFGAVVLGCKAKKTISLTNTGEVNARFQWKAESFPAELSITPAKGRICPGMKVPFELTYAPVKLSNNTRYENLCCLVEGSSSPTKLTVAASCVAASPNKEVMNFACPVRGSHTLPVSLLNPTNQRCSVRPVIKGKEWSTQLLVSLEPHQNMTLDIIYQPLTMTTDGKNHKGSVFFSFPDGSGMLYALQGTADCPKPEDSIVNELPAKTQLSLRLPVHNWLSRPQRFSVLVEPVKPDKLDATVSINGFSYIDVAALAKREYELSFSSYKEGQFTIKVTFRNEETGEYLFYLLTFKVAPPGALSTIELEATVRRTSSATVEMKNPLSAATTLTVECKSSAIRAPSHHTVPGNSKGALSFEYHPSCTGESTARLTLFSEELGYFHYDLILRALPPPPEKTVNFSTSLGSRQCVVVKFISYSSKYFFEIDCPEYKVKKNISASPGSKARVEVSFEPHQLGESRGQLTVSNGSVGEYIFPLCGVCLPPKAQGPFSISNGQSINIHFKNVFLQKTEFAFQVESPHFTVKAVKSMLSKKTQNIEVSFEAPPGPSVGQLCSRLTVTSQSSEGHRRPCSWVYYLKGDSA
ncbi:hydrocephalus-inducing protein homolog isoform X2 [Gouania willdenowi]|uniref:hydrocephalus-inducing protein homolog isoform X2 n=1 Tax=Gouania willdenowi TaxID=441366 RepID=UPI0010559CCE|nr:hydrocephalus-inducing protein-like isoform X2 [Gouania willdenowi]